MIQLAYSKKQIERHGETKMEYKVTVQIDNEFVSLKSTGLRGDTLINHFFDGVIEVKDLVDGLKRGYFTATVLATITAA
jgi:hypothetical protein